jgi:hypothetical protein
MKTMAPAKVCLLLCVVGASLFAQSSSRGVIAGTVIEAGSDDPVRKAVVTATWHGTPRSWATTRTDGSGRFVFEGLPAGKYDLLATKAGLGTAIYGADSVREIGDVVSLGDGETRANLKLRFLRSGAISGRVVDPDGDPVPNANVILLRTARNLGERILTNYQVVNTNDRGEYRMTAVDPGEFYLRCMPNMQRFMGAALPNTLVASQYFGGARDSKEAAPLNIRGGDNLTGMDFHLVAERPAAIAGRVTGVPQLDPPADPTIASVMQARNVRRTVRGGGNSIMVEVSPADNAQMGMGGQGGSVQPPDYRFQMPDFQPGRYRVQATVRAKDKTYYASEMIDAHEGTNEIALAMVPAVEIKGHLKVEGPGSHPPESFTITLFAPPSGGRVINYSSPVKKDGSFAIQDVPPGEWIMSINQSGVFEKSVLLGDKDFLYKHLEIPSGLDAPLNIVLSSNTATIRGEIDAGGADAKRAGILLAPVGKWHSLARFYYNSVSDDNGKFKFNAVAPGKYKIFAVEKVAVGSFQSPEAADLLDALGEELEVTEGAKIELHPKLIPAAKAKEILKP